MYNDLRYGLRMLVKNPVFTAVAVIALALGIGANSAIFSVVNVVLLRPLPYPAPEQLVQVKKTLPPGGGFVLGGGENITGPEFLEWREQNQTLSYVAAYSGDDVNLTGSESPERIICGRVSFEFFPLLGVQPSLGRNFLPEEDQVGGPRVVMISHGLWQRRFGADPNLVGKTVRLNGEGTTVIGVLPASFQFPEPFEMWLPLALNVNRERVGQQVSLLRAIGRLKPGTAMEQARAELDTILHRLQQGDRFQAAESVGNEMNAREASSPPRGGLSQVEISAAPGNFDLPLARDRTPIQHPFPGSPDQTQPSGEAARSPAGRPVTLPEKDQHFDRPLSTEGKSAPEGADIVMDSEGGDNRPVRLLSSGDRVQLVSLHEESVGNVRLSLLVLLGSVSFVLLIGCANVANLLLARAAGRQKEVAIRTALGANRLRVVRQLLTESLLLSFLGGCMGLLLALWGIDVLRFLNLANLPHLQPIRADAWVLGFTLFISLASGLIFGLVPALEGSRTDLNESLKEGSRGVAVARTPHRLRSLLVISEVALAMVLLVSAGLLMRSFLYLRSINPGFRPEGVLTFAVNLTESRYPQKRQQSSFFQQLLERLSSLPGVEAVGATNHLPFTDIAMMLFVNFEGHPLAVFGRHEAISLTAVSRDYFQVMRTALKRGRMFNEHDNETAPPVALINEALGRRYFANEDPVGKRFRNGPGDWVTIVGVVADVRQKSLEGEPDAEIYRPYLQTPTPFMTFAIRTSGDPLSQAAAARSLVASVDKDQPIHDLMTMEQRIAHSIAPRRLTLFLLALFASLALLLAALGIFGVMSYSVAQRTREMGVRMALGAQPDDVIKLVVRQGMVWTLVGVTLS
jgi:MacB-like protein/FtsX-like permease family protein